MSSKVKNPQTDLNNSSAAQANQQSARNASQNAGQNMNQQNKKSSGK